MADKWWEAAPLGSEEPQADDSWWKDAPLAQASDPYDGKSLDDLKRLYVQAGLVGGDDKLKAKIMDAYVAKEARDGGFGLALDDVIRQTAKGIPILGGAMDEISAAANSVLPEALGGAPYDMGLDYQRSRDRFRETQNPESSTAVQLAGGIAGTVAGARALGIPSGAGSTVPLLQRAAAGAAVTAPIVGADAFTRAEGGAGNRAHAGAIGAALGLPLGAAAPVIAQGASSGIQRLSNWLTSDQMLRRLGISRNAANVLLRQLEGDDTLSGTGAARIRQAGPEGMIADAGPAASNLLDTALERSGPGSTMARAAIEARATRANRDLRGTMDAEFGTPVGVETRQRTIREGTAQARGNAYTAAYDTPIDYSEPAGQELWEIVTTRVPQEAVNHANRLMRAEGMASRQIQATMRDDGTVTFTRLPDVRQLDYLTRALNAVARGAEGMGQMGGTTDVGRVYQNLSGEIRGRLRTLVPEYAAALDTAADPIRRVQATEFGATILDKSTTREQVIERLAGMGVAERRATIQGLRDQIDEIAANVSAMASDPNIDARQLREVLTKVTSDAARTKITAAIGSSAANRFMGQVRRSMRAMELRASVSRGSRTFGRQATDAQVKEQLSPGIIGLAMEGEVVQATKRAVQMLTGVTPERRLAAEDRLYGEIAQALTQVRGRDAERYLLRLRQAIRARSLNSRAGRAGGTLASDAYLGATIQPTGNLADDLRPAVR